MNRSRIGARTRAALCMLFAAPLLLGWMDGVVLCICESGVHLEALHEGSCGAECAADPCSTETGARMCGCSHACKDTRLGGLVPILSSGVTGKRGATNAPCYNESLAALRSVFIPTCGMHATAPVYPALPSYPGLRQSCILLI